ncbi:MAG: lysophospholipid acyltransferase family protein [Desulfobacterales bacterium]
MKKPSRRLIYRQNKDSLGRNERVFQIIKLLARILLAPFFRMEVAGAENLPADCAFILLAKHQRWVDIPLLGLATSRPLYYIAKFELFKNALSNWFCSALGGIPLNRQRPLKSRRSLNATIELLETGEGLVIFPEGTYYRGQMGPGQAGMVRFVLSRLNLPFIPAGIHYATGGWRIRVRIRFGNAFHREPAMSLEKFFSQLMAEIARLSGLAP